MNSPESPGNLPDDLMLYGIIIPSILGFLGMIGLLILEGPANFFAWL